MKITNERQAELALKAYNLGLGLIKDRERRGLTLEQEADRRSISVENLRKMEAGEIPPILPEGTRVKIGGLAPGVGVVVKEQLEGSLVKYDDFECPNAHYWFSLDFEQ